jgi:hypothetical protein
VEFKTIGFANVPKQGKKRVSFTKKTLLLLPKEITNNTLKLKKRPAITPDLIARYNVVFKILKKKLCNVSTLVFPNFKRPFILYYNNSKEHKYSTTLHQIREDNVEHSILYLSKTLNPVKKNYWPTKLKTGIVV